MAECCPHVFAEATRAGQGNQKVTVFCCGGCGWEVSGRDVAMYNRGLAHGRQDAWSKPPRGKPPRWTLAAVICLGLPLVGAGPGNPLPRPPPNEGLIAFGHCARAARYLNHDTTVMWGQKLAVRCKTDECRALAQGEAEFNRERVATAVTAMVDAHDRLKYVLEDAVPCAENNIPSCAEYMAPILVERREAVRKTAEQFEVEVAKYRLAGEVPP